MLPTGNPAGKRKTGLSRRVVSAAEAQALGLLSVGTEKVMQPSLIHIPIKSDVVYTPPMLAKDMVNFFKPSGFCLDPCKGNGVFLKLLPLGAEWCEIEQGRDFYAWGNPVDWIVSNPPFSHYSAWMRHSMKVAQNIVYVMPVYKVFTSGKFQDELFEWGGIVHIRRYGTGKEWGFSFGHALAAVHYKAGYNGSTRWSRYAHPTSISADRRSVAISAR